MANDRRVPSGRVHGEVKAGDWHGFGETDRHRIENTADNLITNQQRDHRQNDSAGGAECEALVFSVFVGETVGRCRGQRRAAMGSRAQPIREPKGRVRYCRSRALLDLYQAAP